MLNPESRVFALGVQLFWRRKYHIRNKVELYYRADIEVDPNFADTIILYHLPLSPLEVSFFNQTQRAPQKFISPSFVVLAIFYCIKARPELRNGKLNLEHFLYYISQGRSFSNNRLVRSPTKKKKKLKGKADKGKAKVVELVDMNKYLK